MIKNGYSNKIDTNASLPKSIIKPFKTYKSNILKIENVLVNNHAIILDKKNFNTIYKHIDSTKTSVWECGNPFDWLDKDWMEKTYGPIIPESGTFERFNGEITTIHCNNLVFSTNNHIVLFDTALAKGNKFTVKSENITITENITVEEFHKIFPSVMMETMDNPNVVRFRFLIDKDVDGAFLFYFKDGKLDYVTLWWWLC